MRRSKAVYCFYAMAFVLFTLNSCTSEKDNAHKEEQSFRVESHQFNMTFDKPGNYNYGDTIHLQVTSIDSAFTISRVELFINNALKPVYVSENGQMTIPGTKLGGGEINLKVKATFSDETETIRFKDLKLLAPTTPKTITWTIVKKYPHDPSSFTQGFLLKDGFLYEGTGTYGASRLRKLDLATGKVLMQRDVSNDYFGEGITIFHDTIFEITYKSSRGFTYNAQTFEPIGEFTYNNFTNEGWGLTNNDTSLIMSDGSSFIYYMDPKDFKEQKRINVFDDKGNVDRLNELEYVNGTLYANIYTEADIVEIDPATGMVKGKMSLKGIMEQNEVTPNMDVLNGIAYNPATGNLVVTGKYWSKLYEIRVK